MIYEWTNAFFVSSLNKTNRFHAAIALYSYNSQGMSKCAKNISDTLNCPQLVLGIQWVKHSIIVNSSVVSLAFSLLHYCCAICYILLHVNNWQLEQAKMNLMCHFFVLTKSWCHNCHLLLNRCTATWKLFFK